MVPPLANTFSSTMLPSVTSALVDNLINNNPTPTSAGMSTTITSSAIPSQQSAENEANANTSVNDNSASQLFLSSPNPSGELIKNEQNVIQPPSSLPAFYQAPSAPVHQQFVQSEGKELGFEILMKFWLMAKRSEAGEKLPELKDFELR